MRDQSQKQGRKICTAAPPGPTRKQPPIRKGEVEKKKPKPKRAEKDRAPGGLCPVFSTDKTNSRKQHREPGLRSLRTGGEEKGNAKSPFWPGTPKQ